MHRPKSTLEQAPLQRLIGLYEEAVEKNNYLLAESIHHAIQAKVVMSHPPGEHTGTPH